jgi:hypothetical protein
LGKTSLMSKMCILRGSMSLLESTCPGTSCELRMNKRLGHCQECSNDWYCQECSNYSTLPTSCEALVSNIKSYSENLCPLCSRHSKTRVKKHLHMVLQTVFLWWNYEFLVKTSYEELLSTVLPQLCQQQQALKGVQRQ